MTATPPAAGLPRRPGRRRFPRPLIPLLFSWVLLVSPGCEVITPGVYRHPNQQAPFVPIGQGTSLEAPSAKIYQKVRQAAAQNSVVLEIAGEEKEEPVRVLPLPPAGERSVFVSDLLVQTGVLAKLGSVDVTLYRSSPNALGAIRMDVKMSAEKDRVRPESDYALRPGDRLRVEKAEFVALTNLFSAVSGL